MSRRIGIDTGGTFTDLVDLGPDGLTVHKLRSTPANPADAILTGIEHLAAATPGIDVVHGSTVATNAVLERKGARVALVATRGFEDVVRIGRQTRAELYNVFLPLPRPLVDPAVTFGVTERLDASGAVVSALTDAEIAHVASALKGCHADVVAVCLLHSYVNHAHEARLAAALRAGGWQVSASHEVLPEYREFERWSTTVVNAYVTPIIDRYLGALEAGLGRRRLSIMQSNGGSISSAQSSSPTTSSVSGMRPRKYAAISASYSAIR